MAMSTETMTSSTDWIQFYHHNLPGEAHTEPATIHGSGQVSDSTVVTTTFTSTSVPSPRGSGSDHHHLSPDGRVSKPIRRRSRASRRTPTTLLNTDTNNFRAMVQQFTGSPNQAFTTGFQNFPSGANFSFGQGSHVQHVMNPAPALASNQYHLQFQQQQQQQQQLRANDQQLYHRQVENQPFVVSSLNNFHVPANAFLQRLDESRTTPVNDENNNHNNNNNNNNML